MESRLYKIVLTGVDKPGITYVAKRLIGDSYKEADRKTIGVDFGSYMEKTTEAEFKAQIWDTSTDEKFRHITSSYYRGAQAIGFCVNCAVPLSQQRSKLEALYRRVDNATEIPLPSRVVILTRLDERKPGQGIFEEDIPAMRSIFGELPNDPDPIQFVWVSAHTNTNISQLKRIFRDCAIRRLGLRNLLEQKTDVAAKIEVSEIDKAGIRNTFTDALTLYNRYLGFFSADVKDTVLFDQTEKSRKLFCESLQNTAEPQKSPAETLIADVESGKITLEQAQEAALAVKTIAPYVADCRDLTAERLEAFVAKVKPILSAHTRSSRIFGRLAGAATAVLITGLVLGLLTSPAAPVIIGVLAAGVAGLFLFGYLGGKAGEKIKLSRNPHKLHTLKQAAEQSLPPSEKKGLLSQLCSKIPRKT